MRSKQQQKTSAGPGPRHELTELGNSRRFTEDHIGRLIYVDGPGWYRWNGKRWWLITDKKMVLKYAKMSIVKIKQEARGVSDESLKKAIDAWRKSSASLSKANSMMTLAAAGEIEGKDLIVSQDRLDADRTLLNTPSGIVNLETGEVFEHSREFYMTHMTRASYDPEADMEPWTDYLKFLIPNDSMRAAFKRCCGAAAAGYSIKTVPVLWGRKGDNGKTAVIEVMSQTLGSYAGFAMESTFTNASSNTAQYDLAGMLGRRLVSFSELREGRGLAAERIKRVSGGDTYKARNPYGRPFDVKPEFMLFIVTNHLPAVDPGDRAMWKRLWPFPFDVVIPRSQRQEGWAEDFAREHGPGVLRWIVEGSREWFDNSRNLGPRPKKMKAIRDTWRRSEDPVGRWLDECCLVGSEAGAAVVVASALHGSFKAWAYTNNETEAERMTAQKFNKMLDGHEIGRVTLHSKALGRTGVALRPSDAT